MLTLGTLGAVWLLVERPQAVNLDRLDADSAPETRDFHALPDIAETALPREQDPSSTPVLRVVEDFHMLDLDSGWLRYDDGTVMVTRDGGTSSALPLRKSSRMAAISTIHVNQKQ